MGSSFKADEERLRRLLRKIRLDAELRQSDVAERLSKPQSYVSKYEAGERRLSFLEVREVCHAVGIRFEVFARMFEKPI